MSLGCGDGVTGSSLGCIVDVAAGMAVATGVMAAAGLQAAHRQISARMLRSTGLFRAL